MTNANISAGSTISVYQSWGMGRDEGDDLRQMVRRGSLKDASRAMARAEGAYSGCFDLAKDLCLEEIYVALQNDSHEEGWVKATAAQDGWMVSSGGAPSLSMGDMLIVSTDGKATVYFVSMVGFEEVPV
tara:strand:- start:19772 stop:20158 length:387 start_codon:yes stop_codon:yes gene_type:complete